MTAVRHIAFLLLPALLAAGCGQKGPLFLEGRQPHAKQRPAAQKPAPVQPAAAPEPAEKEPVQEEPH